VLEEEVTKLRTKTVKAMVLGMVLICVCLFANVAYGLGGGGHQGDGRGDSPRPAACADGNGSCSGMPVAHEPLRVPEPITALLLGFGIISLATARRRFGK
jgi:hypothetical protein